MIIMSHSLVRGRSLSNPSLAEWYLRALFSYLFLDVWAEILCYVHLPTLAHSNKEWLTYDMRATQLRVEDGFLLIFFSLNREVQSCSTLPSGIT